MRLRVQKYTLFPYTTLFRSLKELILAYSFENHHHLISIQLNHLVYQIEHQLLKVIRSPSNQDLLKLPNDLVDSMYKIVLPTSGVGLHLLLLSLHLLNIHEFFLLRSEERRVGKECRSSLFRYQLIV